MIQAYAFIKIYPLPDPRIRIFDLVRVGVYDYHLPILTTALKSVLKLICGNVFGNLAPQTGNFKPNLPVSLT